MSAVFGLGLRGRRQGHDQTTGGRDDQPPRGGFGRTQQPQHGAVEMAGQGEPGLPPEGRSAVVRPPGGGLLSVATPTRRFASTSPQGGGERAPPASPAMATRPARMRFSASSLS